MKREEIEEQIEQILDTSNDTCMFNADYAKNRLTSLFIELSAELCKEQKESCVKFYTDMEESINQYPTVQSIIVNAPIPEIK